MISIKKIFEGTVGIETPELFQYKPLPTEKKVVGVLLTDNLVSSISFSNGTNLLLHGVESELSLSIAPDKRIITVDETLDGLVKGSIKKLNNKEELPRNSSVYLIIEKE